MVQRHNTVGGWSGLHNVAWLMHEYDRIITEIKTNEIFLVAGLNLRAQLPTVLLVPSRCRVNPNPLDICL